MYRFKFNIFKAIKALELELTKIKNESKQSSVEDFKSFEQIFKKKENEYTSQDKLFIVEEISNLLMSKSEHTSLISNIFRPLLVDLVSRYIQNGSKTSLSPSLQSLSLKKKKSTKQQQTVTNKNAFNIPEIENITYIFSQLLPTTPQLRSLVIQFYKKQQNSNISINIFDSINQCKNFTEEKEERWLRLVQSCYRLLSFNKGLFSSLWDWTPLFSLLEIKSQRITWYVIKSMSMVLNVPDHQITQIKPLFKQYHNQIIQIESELLNLESSKLFLNQHNNHQQQQQQKDNINNESTENVDEEELINKYPNIFIQKQDLHNSIVDVCGILLFKKFESIGKINHSKIKSTNTHNDDEEDQQKLVYTNTVSQNLNSLAIAVGLGKPILIEGVTGSGKTTMIEELSRITGNDNIIRIHLGDQTDSKVLLGTYITSDTPGEFKWQAGALTQAVQEGRWILIEDIDLAPIEVLSVLIPLLENRTLFIPGRGEVIEASNGFQLFATQTLFGSHSRDQNANILSHLWTRVVIEALSPLEMKQVLSTLFPQLSIMISKFIETFNLLLRVISNQSISISTSDEVAGIANIANSATTVNNNNNNNNNNSNSNEKFIIPSSRFISSRDLIKWIRRCNQRLHLTTVSNNIITSTMQEIVFVEALDCFCSMISKKNLRKSLTEVIGRVWELTADRINYHVELYKPSIIITENSVSTGRAKLKSLEKSDSIQISNGKKHTRFTTEQSQQDSGVTKHGNVFAHTMNSLRLMEKISISIQFNEPILLVGETGTGKTSVVQYIADQLNQKLVVLNLNQQSDSSDLIGGFKPVEMRLLCLPLKNRFDSMFKKTFSESNNTDFLEKIDKAFISKNWKQFIGLLNKAIKLVETKVLKEEPSTTKENKKRVIRTDVKEKWIKLSNDIKKLTIQFEKSKNNFAFSFVEGSLVNCIRKGHWVLLDEMNLATSETLESLSGLFDGGSITLTEKGEVEPVERHPNFKVFACMNPPTDIGKKDLPPGIRNRFTEYYVDDLDNRGDLCLVVKTVLSNLVPNPPIEDIVEFYLKTKQDAQNKMLDGSNQKPIFSLRTLSRALNYTKYVTKSFGFQRALFEGISMSFLTQLNKASYPMMEQLIKQYIKKGEVKLYNQPLNKPPPTNSANVNNQNENFVKIEQFWIECGNEKPVVPTHYILTPSIKSNLSNIARVLVSRKHPILLQGPTSSGKTSMVEYLAIRTGHRFIRINNHEHTDLQEYLGQYISDDKGKLVFQEGILVEAVRKGYWVVLDELNLAPSEVLEALNRLLDDNRELFIPETQEVVRPHPHFMLFATQNPPGLYGGRKVLSRAFRNRFLELHVDDIPEDELEEILCKRCALPPSYCKKLVLIMKELQLNRQGSNQVFAGKHGAITFRDLFRWAERHPSSYEELGIAGYQLLAERLRKDEEKLIIKQVIEKHLKIKLDIESIYSCDDKPEFSKLLQLLSENDSELSKSNHLEKIVWTRSMKRLFSLVGKCLEHKEPILLVGETGCSKTTICQLYSILNKQKLHILNCHQHTETADFIGGLRPVRGRDQVLSKLYSLVKQYFNQLNQLDLYKLQENDYSSLDQLPIKEIMERLIVESWKQISTSPLINDQLKSLASEIDKTYSSYCSLFNWVDGPLVEAMKQGDYFLIDEISLAEDAVLERLNSVLEPSRLLVLAEKGGIEIEELRGHQEFRILATMNPGGDFGKKELSPAMRNRFTEIWVPAISSHQDLLQIIEERFTSPLLNGKGKLMLNFIEYLLLIQKNKRVISLRDILSWISFMNLCMDKQLLSPNESYIHGACLVLLDGFGMGSNSSSESEGLKLREACLNRLIDQIESSDEKLKLQNELLSTNNNNIRNVSIVRDEKRFGIHPFYISVRESNVPKIQFSLSAPTTSKNAQRVLRGMQLPRAILVEGSPGVGKTSLITAIANASGNQIVRINLSEQTDIMDLLGSDLPVEGGTGGQFEWRDGVFLEALRNGSWVLLDELNLASQTVLEGLNSCLDHRSEVYIPELGKTFTCHPNFRVFACQNPLHQGGGRKGLPKSFLNRFTQVFIDQLNQQDLLFISTAMYPTIPSKTIERMIEFNHQMFKESMIEHKFARKGAPWEFNLRDTFRWCDLIVKDSTSISNPARFIDLIYLQRMRTLQDREHVLTIFKRVFTDITMDVDTDMSTICNYDKQPHYTISPEYLQIGSSILPRVQSGSSSSFDSSVLDNSSNIQLLQRLLNPLENIMKCIEMNWMSILIGPTSTSKTSSIRLLAQLTGNTLYEFSMNSSVDTTEILGGFEQIDLVRYQKRIISSVSSLITIVCSHIMTYFNNDNDSDIMKTCISSIQDIHQVWNLFKNQTQQYQLQQQQLDGANNSIGLITIEQLDLLSTIVEALEKLSIQFNLDSQQDHLNRIQDIKQQIQRIKSIEKESVTGCFEWIDGLLIKALETGAWILIDNVNFCNPTVLDRLNPLLEQDGVLMLNERGMVDGQVKVVKPHPNFRIFLTMDDKKGEISRAMRNRGIEIYMPDQTDSPSCHYDNQQLLTALGIPLEGLTRTMIDFHSQIFTQLSSTTENPCTLSQLLYWGKLILDQLQRGFSLLDSIRNSMEQIYIRPRRHLTQRQLVTNIFNSIFNQSAIDSILNEDQTVLGIYPHFINGKDYVNDSISTTMKKNYQFFEYYLKRLIENSDSQQDESNYKISAKFLIENINSSQYENYVLYLNSLKNQNDKEASINQLLTSLISCMKQLFNHSCYKAFEQRLEQLLSMINLSFIDSKQLLIYQGHQWKNNDSLFLLIKEKVDNYVGDNESMISIKDLFNQVLLNDMEIIKSLLSLFIQSSKQEKEYNKFLKQIQQGNASQQLSIKSIKSIPVILLSLAYTKKMMSKDLLPHQDIISIIYRLFKSLDEQIDQWLIQLSQQQQQQQQQQQEQEQEQSIFSTIQILNQLVLLKNNFWNSTFNLPSRQFNLGEFIIRWRWIYKEISKLTNLTSKSDSPLLINTGLQVLIEKINTGLNQYNNDNSNNRLWKVGGYPLVMKSNHLVQLDTQFLGILEKVQFNFNKNESPIKHCSNAIDEDWKKTLIEAISTLYWANYQLNSDSKEELDRVDEFLKNLELVPQTLSDKLKQLIEKQKQFELNSTFNPVSAFSSDENNDSMIMGDGTSIHFDPLSIKHQLISISPLIDHSLHLKETFVIAQLVQLLMLQHMDIENGKMKQSIIPILESIIDELKYIVNKYKSSTIPRSLYHLAFYQKLIWMIDNYLEKVTTSQEESQQQASIGIIELQSVIHSILYVYNSSQWNNAFNDISHVGKFSLPQYKYRLSKNDVAANLVDSKVNHYDSIRFGYGPPRLFQNIQTVFSFYLTCDWEYVSIAEVPIKIDQLNQIIQHLTSADGSSKVSNIESFNYQIKQSIALLLSTITSFYKSFNNDQEKKQLLSNIITLGDYLLSDAIETENNNDNDIKQLIENIKKLLVESNDKSFNEISKQLLLPCLDILLSLTLNNQDLYEDELKLQSTFGRLQLLLNTFRLIMLVPSGSIDPTQKYDVILQYSKEHSKQLQDEIDIRSTIEKQYTGKDGTSLVIDELIQKKQSIDQKLTLDSKKITLRPIPSQFEELYRDVSQFSNHFSNIEKIIDLISKLDLSQVKNEFNLEVELENQEDSEQNSSAANSSYNQMILSTESMWQEKANHFIQSCEKKFYTRYRDIIVPIVTTVYQMKSGLRMMAVSFKQRVQDNKLGGNKGITKQIQKVLLSLTQFPRINSIDTNSKTTTTSNNLLLDKLTLDSIKDMMKFNQKTNQDNCNGGLQNFKVIGLLLRSSLCQIYSQLSNSNYLDVDNLEAIDSIFRIFVQEWRFQEEEKRKKEELENQEFKYKVQTHKMETKEEKDEKVFLTSFPNFYKDFEDLEVANIVENQVDNDEDKEVDSNTEASANGGDENSMFFKSSINNEEILQLCSIHRDIFKHLDGIPIPKEEQQWKLSDRDRSELFQLFYTSSYLLMKILNQRSGDMEFDQLSLGSHILSASNLKETLSVRPPSIITYSKLDEKFRFLKTSSYLYKKSKGIDNDDQVDVIHQNKTYNIYRDPNISEIGIIREPLISFRKRVLELLIEYPEQANLTLMVKLIDRLMTYPATDPLAKILTGLELLLRKSLEWESFASKAVSIQSHLNEVSSLIVRWRKLEIESWPSIFQSQEKEAEVKALKSWFILYDLINDEPSSAELEADNLSKNFHTLQQYLYSSSLGDFLTRIELLKSFYKQLNSTIKLIGTSKNTDYKQKLSDIIYNIFKYFENFISRFEDRLAKSIKPIEDKALEFIRLSRWDDNRLLTQYERLKQHIEVSHRNLAKITIKYKNVLAQPLHDIFTQIENELDIPPLILHSGAATIFEEKSKNNQKNQKKQQVQKKSLFIETFNDWLTFSPSNYSIDRKSIDSISKPIEIQSPLLKKLFQVDNEKLLQNKLPLLSKRMIQICKENLLESDSWKVVRDGVDIINDLSIEIIDRLKELSDEKVKRQEKEFALKELMSKFQEMGLSYHTNHYPQEQLQISYLFNVRHLPTISDNQGYLPTSFTKITADNGSKLLDQADQYYYRIVSRVHRLRQLSIEYSSDLSSKHVQKINGYIEHFLSIIIAQRNNLIDSVNSWNHLTLFTELFTNISGSNTSEVDEQIFNNHNMLSKWFEIQRESINQFNQAVNEILLLCKKTTSAVSGGMISTIIPEICSVQSIIESIKSDIDKHQSKLRNLFSFLNNQYPMMTWSTINLVVSIFTKFKEIKDKLNQLLLSKLSNINYIKSPIQILINNIDSLINQFNSEYEELIGNSINDNDIENQNNIKEFTNQFGILIDQILISIQDLKTQSNQIIMYNKEQEELDQELERVREYTIEDGSISKLSEFIDHQVQSLKLSKLLEQFVILHNIIVNGGGSVSTLSIYRQMIKQMGPLLAQFMLIVNQSIVDSLSYHKTCCKLEYIVSGVFIQLYSKGFCKPADAGDDGESGEGGKSTFEDDVEGTGMGEGKGKKDVSDQIEDQGQIEDTNTQKKEEKDNDEDEEKEEKDEDQGFDMEDDFEGEMHDIKKDENKDQDKKDDPNNEKENDKEMGDLEKPEDNVVDEKLWDEQDVQDEEEQDEEGKGDETNSEEMMAKQDGKDDKKDDKDEKKDDKKKKEENGKPDEDELGEEGKDEEAGDDENKDANDGASDEEDFGQEENEDDVINQEQEKEENHGDPRGDDQMEIPEDLELDDPEEGKEDEQQDGGDDFKDPLDEMDGDDVSKEEEKKKELDGDEKEESDQDGEEKEDENQEDEKEDQEEKENQPIDPANVDSVNPEGGDEPEKEQPEEDQTSLTTNEQQDETPKDSEQPLGVKDKTGSKSNVSNTDEEMKDESNQDNADDDSGMTQPTPSENDTGAMKNLKSQQQPQSNAQQPKKQKQVDPNPYRSMGDANKEWKKRLNLKQEQEDQEEESSEPKEKAPKQDPNAKENENQDYEFIKDDEKLDKDEETDQALAAATDSQLQDIPQNKAQDEQAEQEEDQMDIDEEDDMDVDHKQEVEHQDESKQELDQNKKISMSKLKQDQLKQQKEKEKEKLEKDQQDGQDENTDGLNQKEQFSKEQLENITNLDKEKAITDEDQEMEPDDEEDEESLEEKKLTREDLDRMRQELEQYKIENSSNPEIGNELWKKYEQLTNDLSQDLCEQLRLILEPTLATKLQGDYKSGKRINMKKVIPYIASQFKKDKIWLRRTKPNKRQYQVLLAIDDTESMATYHSGGFALEAMTMISRAMSRLEVGQLGIVRFGEDVQLVHSFDQVFSDQTGPEIITQFKFQQTKTNMVNFLSKTLQIMEMNKQSSSGEPAMQLVFIVSDGWSLRDPETTKKYLREASIKNVFIVFIVIDNPVNNNSILDFESISFNNGKIQRTNYMSEFPFLYYVILRSLNNIPSILSDTLRQWFDLTKSTQ
ncbi:hypothetical protein RB653_002414 [Dictyostelium firmibasis]|uniref:Midasin n=1 Tax=Dictyostelium firmibasis TaxID=79012 RepID=A0AAN7U8W7_9MYCE